MPPQDPNEPPVEFSFVSGLDAPRPVDLPEEEPEEPEDNTAMLAMGAALFGIVGAVFLAVAYVAGSMMMAEIDADGKIVVVNRDLRPGEKLSREDLEAVPGAMVNTWHKVDDLVGATVKLPLYAGDAVRSERLQVSDGSDEGLAAPEDHVWLREGKGISGLGLEAGDRVDIWSAGGPRHQSIVAEDVLVLDLGRGMQGTARRITFVIAGDPGRAVELARDSGLLHLALRPIDPDNTRLEQWAVEVPPLPEEGIDAQPVLHLTTAVAPGQPIEAAHLAPRPGNAFVQQAFTSVDETVGRMARELLLPGEILTEGKLADGDIGRGLSALLLPNQRGVALSIGNAPIDALPPGTLLTITNIEGTKATETLAEGVEVIGISPTGIGCPCIVLGVDESDAGTLLNAQALGSLGVAVTEPEAHED